MNAKPSFRETFLVFLRLGLTSFGGPTTHLGYFHQEFVIRRKWMGEHAFVDLLALAQFLPGPASSQVGLVIGLHRARWRGALGAWLGFTLPSALLMVIFALGIGRLGDLSHAGWLAGLKLAAVAVVANAVLTMAAKFCAKAVSAMIGLVSAAVVFISGSGVAQIIVIAAGAAIGWLLLRRETRPSSGRLEDWNVPFTQKLGTSFLILFFALLIGLPFLRNQGSALAVFDNFYRVGALVFGGGHVVLPLLQTAVVNPGWIDESQFLAGYGAAQALPGPLFTFAAYLGAILKTSPTGWIGAVECLFAIYLPAVLLILGALPFWISLRRRPFAQGMIMGANAAVVGVLLAAFIRPVWTSAVQGPVDFLIALAAYFLLVALRTPPWLVVVLSALAGQLILR